MWPGASPFLLRASVPSPIGLDWSLESGKKEDTDTMSKASGPNTQSTYDVWARNSEAANDHPQSTTARGFHETQDRWEASHKLAFRLRAILQLSEAPRESQERAVLTGRGSPIPGGVRANSGQP